MPDSTPPDWIDDADFWDEAWQDMQQQLEAAPPPVTKKSYSGGWIIVLLLLGLLAGVCYSHSGQPAATQQAPPRIITAFPLPVSPEPLPKDSPSPATSETTRMTTGNVTVAHSPQPPARLLPLAAGRQQRAAATTKPTQPNAQHSPPSRLPTTENAASVEATAASVPIVRRATPRSEAIAPLPIARLAAYATVIKQPDPALADPAPVRRPELFLEAGLTYQGTNELTGGLIAGQLRLPLRRKLALPLAAGFRYRQHDVSIAQDVLRSNDFLNTASAYGQLFLDPAFATHTRLTERSLFFGSGLHWQWGRRWAATAWVEADYLVAARGIAELQFEAEEIRLTIIDSGVAVESAAPQTGGNTNNENVIINRVRRNALARTDLHRLRYRVGLQLAWRLAPRLDLSLRSSRMLTSPYRSSPLSATAQQWSLGARWRLP